MASHTIRVTDGADGVIAIETTITFAQMLARIESGEAMSDADLMMAVVLKAVMDAAGDNGPLRFVSLAQASDTLQ